MPPQRAYHKFILLFLSSLLARVIVGLSVVHSQLGVSRSKSSYWAVKSYKVDMRSRGVAAKY
jgi:hypothetical protein